MILADTNVLVALLDPRDALSPTVRKTYQSLRDPRLTVVWPVLTETFFLLDSPILREKLVEFCRRAPVDVGLPLSPSSLSALYDWLHRYQDHAPDLADAYLITAADAHSGAKIWTHDSEFWEVWRTLDGSPPPLLTKSRK